MKKLIFLGIIFFTIPVFSENYTCVLNKWFDTPVGDPVLEDWKRDGNIFLRNGGRKYSIMFEDETRLTLINSMSRFDINTVIINKENGKITSSLTMDDRVIVLKGKCKLNE